MVFFVVLDMYMKFNYDSTKIIMEMQENPGPLSEFHKFQTRGNSFMPIHINWFSIGESIFSFERIEEEVEEEEQEEEEEEQEEEEQEQEEQEVEEEEEINM